MAKFCTKCGAALQKDDAFCPECGAKVRKETVTIREDGKGGLIIDAPAGSTVTISDKMPKH
ncbi:MAG: zinc ribbon domain-containing protein [Solobacterium sp.]|nr:zinc ribbon domain-containing protein [Solobacterium sp.]